MHGTALGGHVRQRTQCCLGGLRGLRPLGRHELLHSFVDLLDSQILDLVDIDDVLIGIAFHDARAGGLPPWRLGRLGLCQVLLARRALGADRDGSKLLHVAFDGLDRPLGDRVGPVPQMFRDAGAGEELDGGRLRVFVLLVVQEEPRLVHGGHEKLDAAQCQAIYVLKAISELLRVQVGGLEVVFQILGLLFDDAEGLRCPRSEPFRQWIRIFHVQGVLEKHLLKPVPLQP
mmetsp:Transcript_12296/g.34983  ORF Transcript_12296/g.34983 Transcript_12296/m.34983 type:complete len:231 (+) Transcript_12296:552-1244(+)